MIKTKIVVCPFCSAEQYHDIYGMIENKETYGTFEIECCECDKDFNVEFELVSYVKTY